MVLFCHAIATANLSDLKCLGDFVSTLQTSGETVEAAEKLRRLCHVFHRVAELYIQTKIKHQHRYQYDSNNGVIEQSQLENMQYHPQQQQQQQSLTSPSSSTAPLNIPPTPQPDTNANTDPTNNTFKYSNPPPSSQFPIDDFEPYLSALGFPNAAGFLNIGQQQQQQQQQQQPPQQQQQNGLAPQMTATTTTTAPTDYTADNLEASLGSGDAMSLENWFNGNVNLMSLLEMDLSSIIK
jgi:hypothetical protein